MLIVTLSTIPPRFHLVGATLETIRAQDTPIDAIELWIPRTYRRFPRHAFCLPEVPEGVTVRVTDTDYGPATKVLPAACAYRGLSARILYCDDDQKLSPGWARSFLAAASERVDCAIAASGYDVTELGFAPSPHMPWPRARHDRAGPDALFRARCRWRRIKRRLKALRPGRARQAAKQCKPLKRAGYLDIMEGFAGGLVRPDMFAPEDYEIPDRLWSVDDVWLSGMLARKRIGIWGIRLQDMPEEWPDVAEPLRAARIDGLGRDAANKACIRHLQAHYRIWQ